jgi:hypothetical protein
VSDEALLGALLSDARAQVRRLLDEPLLDAPTLVAALGEHVARMRLAAGSATLADWQGGLDLAVRARTLVDRWPTLDHHGRRLVQVAVRYLVLEDDGDADLDSPFGFDDDREVLEAVERLLRDAGR